MRKEPQGSICDFCGKEMLPHRKVQIRYCMTTKDNELKNCISAKSINKKAYDLCIPCAIKISEELELMKIMVNPNPLIGVLNEHKKMVEKSKELKIKKMG